MRSNNKKIISRITSVTLALALMLLFSCCNKNEETNNLNPPVPPETDSVYYRGMDLSFQPEIEDWQTKYYDENGNEVELLSYLAEKGVNLIRLKLWHTPDTSYNGLESVLQYASKASVHNMEILLDFHYSDTWADPGKQFLPAAWEGLTISQLNDSVYAYTKSVLQRFKEEGVMPSMVQIGNETNSGFLWDQGRVGGAFDNNWINYSSLVKSAINGINEVDENQEIKIMLHFAGLDGAIWFFDNNSQYLVDFDIIGLSYYSLWHGNDLSVFQTQLNEIAGRYSKEIMVVETGYPWSLGWNDWTNNFFGSEDQLIAGYPATPEGQKLFMEQLNSIITGLGKQGLGYCYWAPEWVAFKGPEADNGSVWENVTVFDFDNKVLPVIEVFGEE